MIKSVHVVSGSCHIISFIDDKREERREKSDHFRFIYFLLSYSVSYRLYDTTNDF